MWRSILVVFSCSLLIVACQSPIRQGQRLGSATFTDNDQLQRPDFTEWVFMGTNLGLGYAEGEFRNDKPGTFQLVYMEPEAYQYFLNFREYADGTQFALAFYEVEEKTRPELNGFGQGELISFEIHLLDKERFTEQRAFYLFTEGLDAATMIPEGSECVECHNEHAAYDSTFTQFYPPLRHLTPAL